MPRYYTYKPGVKGSGLTLGAGQHLGFKEGEGYYAAAGKARKPKPQPKPLDIGAMIQNYFRGSMLTPQQQRAEARRQVSESMAEATKAWERQRAEARAETSSRQLTAVGLAGAMQAMKGADADTIRQAWSQAGGNMSSFASALTGSVQGAQQGALASSQADVNRLAPGGEVLAPSPEANQQVSNFTGGTLPAATAQRNAEAQYQGAIERGDIAAARFWDQQRAIEYEGVQQEGKFNRDLADLRAQEPKLRREAEAAQQQRAREELATLMNVMTSQQGLEKTRSEIERSGAQTQIDRGKLTIAREAELRKEQERKDRNTRAAADRRVAKIRADAATQNAATARGKALGIDPVSGAPLPGYKFDAKGNVIKDPKQAATADKSQQMEMDFRKFANDWFKKTFVDKDLGRPRRRPPTKAELVRRIMGLYGNALVGKGVSKAGVQMWATQVLNSYDKRWWTDAAYGPKPGAAKASTGGGQDLLG